MESISAGAEKTFDVVVIGAGPVGENAAARAVRGGLTACVVEERLVGGECSFWACIPSKALLRPVHAAAAARRVRGVAGDARVEAAEVFARRDSFTGRGDDSGQVEWLEGNSIGLVRGRGRLSGERRVEVALAAGGAAALVAQQAVVLAVGTAPAIPPIDGLREARPWTNREATTAAQVPERLVILGGGVVACEMAAVFAGLGSHVTMVVRGDRLLARYEPFAGELLADSLRAAGVDVCLSASAEQVTRAATGVVTVRIAAEGGVRTVDADEVLAALGRRPATDDLGLEAVGLAPGKYVEVDDSLRATGVPGSWLYAVGDVNGRALLTHMGKYQGRVCGDVIAARAAGRPDDRPGMRAWADHRAVPQVVFTDPEVCAVGLTLDQAQRQNVRVRAVEYEIGDVSGASLHADGYQGRARLIVDEDRQVVVGATFVGQDTADLLHSATIAIVGEVPLDSLWHAVPSFPTISEVWLRLMEAYGL
jgi:pyruvate/2-oxoglutarate dehydrogenase complex dihydrolipoamide dehydrogenase (E3) component